MSILEQRIKQKLIQQQQAQLFRRQRTLLTEQNAVIAVDDGKKVINFCSNDYLGLAADAGLKKSFRQAIGQYGCGSGASHLMSGHAKPHQLLAEELAEFLNVDSVLLYSSGYMANLGVFNALLEKNDRIFQDKLNHASLIDAGLAASSTMKRYPHLDLYTLESKLSEETDFIQMIVSDGVFSMDGDSADLPALLALKKKYQAELMIDDAHAFGVLGENGRGTPENSGIKHRDMTIYMATMGKAMGISGAFIAASRDIIESLIQFSRTYTYTTAMPAAQAEALRFSLKLIKTDTWRREKLAKLIAYFKQCAVQLDIPLMPSDTAIQPVLLGNTDLAVKIGRFLFENGFLVSAIRPPTVPANTDRLRVTLSAAHEKNQIDNLLETLSQCLKK